MYNSAGYLDVDMYTKCDRWGLIPSIWQIGALISSLLVSCACHDDMNTEHAFKLYLHSGLTPAYKNT